MKRLRVLAFPLLLICAGCLEIDVRLRDPLAPALPAPAPPPPQPITAEQITPANARDMAQALWDELDREEAEQDRAALQRALPQ
jgi:hypothetical protein